MCGVKVAAEEASTILAQAFCRVEAQLRCGSEPSRLRFQAGRERQAHFALDGKTLRGTLGHTQPHHASVHLLALYEVASGTVLAQRAVQSKENEISALDQVLTPTLVNGRIISADALHTRRRFCQQVTLWGGAYVLVAKANQPTLHEDLALFFEEPPVTCTDGRTVTTTKGHGRVERRTITISTELRDWFASEWCELEQVFRIERVVSKKGATSRQVVYGITENEVRMPRCFNRGMKDVPRCLLLRSSRACGMLVIERMFLIHTGRGRHGQAAPDN